VTRGHVFFVFMYKTIKSDRLRTMNKQVIAIYHKSCIDGTSAAAVLFRKFPQAECFPLSHSYTSEDMQLIRDVVKPGAEIYIVDCTLGVNELLEDGHEVTVIDRHISEKEVVQNIVDCNPKVKYIFDNEKSGASLTWAYFFPEEKVLESIKYIEDSDLGIWKYGNDTRQINNYLFMFRNDPQTMLGLIEGDVEVLKVNGALIRQYSDIQLKELVKLPSINVKIGEYIVPAFNITMYQTSCGGILSDRNDSVAVMFTIKGEEVRFSFRSNEHQNPSALELAQILGGGGHRNAAGGNATLEDFLKMIQK